MMDNISPMQFPNGDVPEVHFSRLNEHYRGVVELSRLILRHGSFESGRGRVRATAFLMNMNTVFQNSSLPPCARPWGFLPMRLGKKTSPPWINATS